MLWQFEFEFDDFYDLAPQADGQREPNCRYQITANVEKPCGFDEHSARGVRHAEDVRSRVPLRFTLGF